MGCATRLTHYSRGHLAHLTRVSARSLGTPVARHGFFRLPPHARAPGERPDDARHHAQPLLLARTTSHRPHYGDARGTRLVMIGDDSGVRSNLEPPCFEVRPNPLYPRYYPV